MAGLTPEELTALCQRVFPDRPAQQLEAFFPIKSRQHEVVAFQLRWTAPDESITGETLIARRYISTISWWRREDHGKAQREATIYQWLETQGFPAPRVYAREIGILGDIGLYSMIPGHDWSIFHKPFSEVIRPLAGHFARFLARLHSFDPPEEVRSVVPHVTLPSALANLTAIAQQLDLDELRQIVDQLMMYAFTTPETPPVLLHGDYHFSNVLLLEEGWISGIVDWEYAALGDPRWDVANAYMQLVDFDAAHAAEMFLETYLRYSQRQFEGPPIYNVITPLQQWAVSEWLLQQQKEGIEADYGLADSMINLRDVHRNRSLMALRLLNL